MSETTNVTGMPTMALLPAKNYNFDLLSDVFEITIPAKGRYVDIDSEFFSEDDGEFCVYEEGVLNMSMITKVLFSTSKYPELVEGQLFCPTDLKLSEDQITVYGQVLTMTDE